MTPQPLQAQHTTAHHPTSTTTTTIGEQRVTVDDRYQLQHSIVDTEGTWRVVGQAAAAAHQRESGHCLRSHRRTGTAVRMSTDVTALSSSTSTACSAVPRCSACCPLRLSACKASADDVRAGEASSPHS